MIFHYNFRRSDAIILYNALLRVMIVAFMNVRFIRFIELLDVLCRRNIYCKVYIHVVDIFSSYKNKCIPYMACMFELSRFYAKPSAIFYLDPYKYYTF